MKRVVSWFLSLVLIMGLFSGCKDTKTKYTAYWFDYFDTVTTIVGYEASQQDFDHKCNQIKLQLEEYHKLYDIYNSYNGINNLYTVNQLIDGMHQEVKVDKKIIDLLEFAQKMYMQTQGKVNVAMGSVLKIWHRYRQEGLDNPKKAKLPPEDILKQANKHTNIDDIIINKANSTVCLADSGMTLDVGAVAKGYAAEKVAKWMIEKEYYGYIINIGGNVRTVGQRQGGEKWKIGIENPDTSDTQNPYIEYLELSDMSLVTSGSYQRFYTVDGKNYHHIIDSKTLMPAQNFQSVSVLCEDSGVADALSTALFCLDYEQGIDILKNFSNIEVMWVLPDGQKLYTDGFKDYSVTLS